MLTYHVRERTVRTPRAEELGNGRGEMTYLNVPE